jgi:hypothetical protein
MVQLMKRKKKNGFCVSWLHGPRKRTLIFGFVLFLMCTFCCGSMFLLSKLPQHCKHYLSWGCYLVSCSCVGIFRVYLIRENFYAWFSFTLRTKREFDFVDSLCTVKSLPCILGQMRHLVLLLHPGILRGLCGVWWQKGLHGFISLIVTLL